MKITKYTYEEPTITTLGSVEELTGWLRDGFTWDNPLTTHRRIV
ncbi:hypothetical protein ACFXGA_10175 [Actinosynnema sp. NPDC059335]